MMHHGPFDAEPETMEKMNQYLKIQGYENDFTAERRHHEIYMSDARKTAPEKCKTVIRHPIRKALEKQHLQSTPSCAIVTAVRE